MTARQIQEDVARAHGVTLDQMLHGGRAEPIQAAKKHAMQRCRSELGLTFPQIGTAFRCHHTTVIHHIGKTPAAIRKTDRQAELERIVSQQLRIIREQAQQISFLSRRLEAVEGGVA